MIEKLQIIILFLALPLLGFGQANEEINWIDFEQLEAALKENPKKTFIYFNADWCVYCKKMERNAFKNPEVIKKLNTEFYAVKMNAENTDTITFEGQKFYNKQSQTQRNGIHQIPLLLASRENREFSLPAIVVLDKKFKLKKREFEYLTSANMRVFLTEAY